ncbi:MAG: cobalt transporter CbiM [Thermodesulfobacteriaceae bacterium]|nr:cobalt transporter CbiM [Thermodesulfobacteriaceae bacterium]
MHISEGVLSPGVLMVGGIFTLGGLFWGLKIIKTEDLPKIAVLSSTFFVASLIHIPIGPTSAHLILNGLVGILLGWAAFPAIFLGLIFQALLFQFGGFTTLGVNTFAMAFPAVISYYLFSLFKRHSKLLFLGAFLGGAQAIILGTIFISIALLETEKSFLSMVTALLTTHFPIAIIEGIITGLVVSYLKKVKPEVLK